MPTHEFVHSKEVIGNPTHTVDRTFAHQVTASEQRKRPLGDFLRKAAWALGLSTGVEIVGDTIKSTQSQSTTSSTDTVYPYPMHYSTTTSDGGWLNGLGTALIDVGLLGITVTAAILGAELFKNFKQHKKKKVNAIY